MKPWIASIAVVSVGAALLVAATYPGSTIEVTYHYSTDAQDLMKPLIEKFNNQRHTIGHRPIRVTGVAVSSGSEMLELVGGAPRPTVWTPASQVWGGQLGERTDAAAPTSLGSVVTTPEVLAIWCSEAARRGWVDRVRWDEDGECVRSREPSWDEVIELALQGSPQEPDAFRLGQTNPEASTSGVFALVSQYLAATGVPLTPTNVADATNRASVRRLQRSLVHYGATSAEVRDNLCDLGQGYVSGVYLQEVTVLELNAESCRWGPIDRLMAFYPSGGTFVADYPFYVLADQGTPAAVAAAQLWEWIRGETEAGDKALQDTYFRARTDGAQATPTGADGTPSDDHSVIDPEQPALVLPQPSSAALRIAQDHWNADRNPARVALVVDVSGPMQTAGQLDAMKDGLHRLVDELRLGDSVSDSDRDQVSLTTYSAVVQQPVLEMGAHTHTEIGNAIESITLVNDGGTALFDGVWAGFEPFRALTYGDDSEINALIVISSGVNDAGAWTSADLLSPERILPNLASRPLTRVFTVELSEAAAPTPALNDLSRATYGRSFIGGPDEIVQAFQNIPSYF